MSGKTLRVRCIALIMLLVAVGYIGISMTHPESGPPFQVPLIGNITFYWLYGIATVVLLIWSFREKLIMGWVFAIAGIVCGLVSARYTIPEMGVIVSFSIIVGGVIHQLCKIRRALEQRNDASSRSSRPPGAV